MKFMKRITTVIAVTITTLTMAISISASASTADTNWEVGNNYTRAKEDYSSVYVKNNSMIYSARVSVYGEKSNTTYGCYSVGSATITTTNLKLPPNCQRLIRQLVKELDYPKAHIYFSKYNSSDNGSACGQWSPDSVGSYTVLN